jgi:hypothetical protein
MIRLLFAVAAVFVLVACSDDSSGRWLLLDRDEVSGTNRICTYRDWPGEYVLTLRSSERCEPSIEVD